MDSAELRRIIEEFLERSFRGEAPSIEELCEQHPEHAEPLRRRLALYSQVMDGVLPIATRVREFDGYELLSEIGRGGMGVVFRAREQATGDEVAIKVLSRAGFESDKARVRFLRETAILQQLDHPGIVRVRAAGVVEGCPYIAMDLVTGPCLADLLNDEDRPIEADDALGIAIEVGRALAYAHSVGVTHRDVKPGNIVLSETGEPVLLDFGLAHWSEGSTLTMTRELLGTLAYMAPEQALGERVDERVDVYGLAATLHHMLLGALPHNASTISELVNFFRGRHWAISKREATGLESRTYRVLRGGLAVSRRDRYQDLARFVRDLEALRAGEGVRPMKVPIHRRVRWWVQGYPVSTVTAVALVLMGSALFVLSSSERRRAELERQAEVDRTFLDARDKLFFEWPLPQDSLPLRDETLPEGQWSPFTGAKPASSEVGRVGPSAVDMLDRLVGEMECSDSLAWAWRTCAHLLQSRRRRQGEDQRRALAVQLLEEVPQHLKSAPWARFVHDYSESRRLVSATVNDISGWSDEEVAGYSLAYQCLAEAPLRGESLALLRRELLQRPDSPVLWDHLGWQSVDDGGLRGAQAAYSYAARQKFSADSRARLAFSEFRAYRNLGASFEQLEFSFAQLELAASESNNPNVLQLPMVALHETGERALWGEAELLYRSLLERMGWDTNHGPDRVSPTLARVLYNFSNLLNSREANDRREVYTILCQIETAYGNTANYWEKRAWYLNQLLGNQGAREAELTLSMFSIGLEDDHLVDRSLLVAGLAYNESSLIHLGSPSDRDYYSVCARDHFEQVLDELPGCWAHEIDWPIMRAAANLRDGALFERAILVLKACEDAGHTLLPSTHEWFDRWETTPPPWK